MRWLKSKYELKDRMGDTRTVEKFLWFPRSLPNAAGKWEYRWLERVSIKQIVDTVDVGGSGEWGNYAYCWCDQAWA